MDLMLAKYKNAIEWMDNAVNKGKTWDEVRFACKGDKAGLESFLNSKINDDFWDEIMPDEWIDLAEEYQRISKDAVTVTIPNAVGEDHDNYTEPKNPQSAWQLYKKNLIEEKEFSFWAVKNIEKSSLSILNRLEDDTSKKAPVKGVVVGNVQSGKTANMAGLISMAADYGWNLFIILTGTIENLRLQTQKRLQYDLKNGNVVWNHINRPGQDVTTRMDRLDFSPKSKVKYITCCLKQKTRLGHLYKWINSDIHTKEQLKILVIDDEADQAGLNAKSEDERTAINQLITNIVNNSSSGKNKYGEIPYKSMNYIGYTATPYGNFLNESGAESLFPRDFITLLTPPDIYFGPQQIFGDPFSSAWDGMPIINRISSPNDEDIDEEDVTDTELLDALIDNGTGGLPDSLKNAIAWFCDCVAIQRYRKSKHPVSMLIHHTHKTTKHNDFAKGIYKWYKDLSIKDFFSLCETVYKEQTARLSKDIFIDVCAEYGVYEDFDLEDEIKDYPSFEEIKDELMVLFKKMEHISINDEGEIHFNNGIHLCIDNSATEEIADVEDEAHVRLLYPTNENPYDGYASAFMVIGGNTLSRGLTLEGLVCTYFSRNVTLGDSLMQMGRWFGYRRGYELLPRLWFTNLTQQRFEFLTELDSDLRNNLMKYQGELTPLQCAPMILNTPGLSFLRITAANKMKGAVAAEMNFAGVNMQTIIFRNDDSLRVNLDLAEKFLTDLDEVADESKFRETHRVWYKVPFKKIWDELLTKGEFNFGMGVNLKMLKDWIEALTAKGQLEDWNVVLSGKKFDKSAPDTCWMNIGKINRSRKITGMYGADTQELNIGVLSDPNDWSADLPDGYHVSEEDKSILGEKSRDNKLKVSKEQAKSRIREDNGFGKVPVLIIYCVDKNSSTQKQGRAPLNVDNDIIGLFIRIPGERNNSELTSRLTIITDEA